MAASPDGIAINMRKTLSAPTLSPLPKTRGVDQLISESVQRLVALTLTAPLEVIKTRSQVGLSSWGLGGWNYFRGNFSSFLILYPSWMARSATGQLFHDAMKEENGRKEDLHPRLKLAAQYVGGVAGNLFSNALDVVAARSMAGRLPAQRFTGVFPALMHLGRTEGMAGMTRGLVARSMNTILSDLVLSLGNDVIDIFESKYLSEEVSSSRIYSLCREVLACSVASTLVYPFDTIKRIIQVDSELYVDPSRHWLLEMFVTPFRCLRDVVEHRGVMALWKGNCWNLAKVFGYVVLVWGTGELTRKYLEQRRNRRRSYLDVLSAVGFTSAAAFALYQFGWLK